MKNKLPDNCLRITIPCYKIFNILGEVRFYQNGTLMGSPQQMIANIGYLGPINEIDIGYWNDWPFYHSIGSIELYLRALSSTQVASAMKNSATYFADPDECPDFN